MRKMFAINSKCEVVPVELDQTKGHMSSGQLVIWVSKEQLQDDEGLTLTEGYQLFNDEADAVHAAKGILVRKRHNLESQLKALTKQLKILGQRDRELAEEA